MLAPADLSAYLARIGYDGEVAPTRVALARLHFLHPHAIPFENFDALAGRGRSGALRCIGGAAGAGVAGWLAGGERRRGGEGQGEQAERGRLHGSLRCRAGASGGCAHEMMFL